MNRWQSEGSMRIRRGLVRTRRSVVVIVLVVMMVSSCLFYVRILHSYDLTHGLDAPRQWRQLEEFLQHPNSHNNNTNKSNSNNQQGDSDESSLLLLEEETLLAPLFHADKPPPPQESCPGIPAVLGKLCNSNNNNNPRKGTTLSNYIAKTKSLKNLNSMDIMRRKQKSNNSIPRTTNIRRRVHSYTSFTKTARV